MISICTACEEMFYKKLKKMAAYEFPQVNCKRQFKQYDCNEKTCKYYFYEDCVGNGCTEFLLCDTCLNDKSKINKMLDFYNKISGN